jgi:hypothetical protein
MVQDSPKIVPPSQIVEDFKNILGVKPIEFALGDQVADQYLRIRKGQFNIVLGHPSVGKTTWLVWYLYKMAMLHGLKSMLYSGENDVLDIYKQLVQCFTGKTYWDVSDEESNLAAEFIHKHFLFIDDTKIYTAEQLFDRFNDKNNCDICVIDPHNAVKVPGGRNWYEYSVELGMEIRAFCKRTKRTVFLVAHPNSEAQRKVHSDGDYKGMIIPPIGPNMEGGSTWKNKCDNLWIIHRYVNHETLWYRTLVIVEKVRYQDTKCKPTPLSQPLMFRKQLDGEFRLGEKTFEEKIGNAPF